MKKIKFFITLTFITLLLSNVSFAKEETPNTVVNPFTGQVLGQASDIIFNITKISFKFNGKQYAFELTQTNQENDILSYIGENDGLRCIVVTHGDRYNINVSKTNTSAYVLRNDKDSLSIFVYSSEQAARENNVGNLITSTIHETALNPLLRSQAHVHAVGPIDIPMLISSGSAEGWLTYSQVSSEEYLATQVKYVTNGGNVQLFYEWQNSVLAWISSKDKVTTTETGNWYLDFGHKDPAFQAEAFSTGLVGNIPVSRSAFDVVHLN